MQFLNKNLAKLFLIIFLVFIPIFSFAEVPPEYEEQSERNGGSTPPVERDGGRTPSTTERNGGRTASDLCQGRICNPIKTEKIQDFIRVVLEGLLRIGMPLLAVAIIYSGFLFVKAQGEPEALTKAKDALLYTLIGAAILLGSWSIAMLISDTVLSL